MPKTHRPVIDFPVALRELHVVNAEDVSPGMRPITLSGAQLGAGAGLPAFSSPGFDDDIRLLFPYPGESEPVLPRISSSGKIEFLPGRRPLARAYTVRGFDAERGELRVDIVRHDSGLAARWALRVEPGERIHIAGPGLSYGLPDAVNWWLIMGDETALPAIARLLEELPANALARVFIEVAESDHRQPLSAPAGASITWLPRNGALAGTTSLLLDALNTMPWNAEPPFVWIAGEQATIRTLRRHLVSGLGVEKSLIDFTGYWKFGGELHPAEDLDTELDS